ncbi:MAG: hypothetical protein WB439_17680 [Acidobacteriaceae bacterium]
MIRGIQHVLEAVVLLQLLVLALHDTIPLGRLNNLQNFRAAVPLRRRVIGSSVNTAVGLWAVWLCWHGAMAGGRGDLIGLIVLQGLLFLGEIRSWWWGYFFGASPETVGHLRPNWEGTIAFLPERNGINLNVVHCVMHALTLAGLVLAVAEFYGA